MTPEERQRFQLLEALVFQLVKSDHYTFEKGIQMLDGRNVQLGKGTGTKIGTATDQKLAFFGDTPVDQPATIADPSGGVTQDAEARTAVNTLIDRLQELGLIA